VDWLEMDLVLDSLASQTGNSFLNEKNLCGKSKMPPLLK
jgi:hypothetical protein